MEVRRDAQHNGARFHLTHLSARSHVYLLANATGRYFCFPFLPLFVSVGRIDEFSLRFEQSLLRACVGCVASDAPEGDASARAHQPWCVEVVPRGTPRRSWGLVAGHHVVTSHRCSSSLTVSPSMDDVEAASATGSAALAAQVVVVTPRGVSEESSYDELPLVDLPAISSSVFVPSPSVVSADGQSATSAPDLSSDATQIDDFLAKVKKEAAGSGITPRIPRIWDVCEISGFRKHPKSVKSPRVTSSQQTGQTGRKCCCLGCPRATAGRQGGQT